MGVQVRTGHITSSFIHQSIDIFTLRLYQSINVIQCIAGWFGNDVDIIEMTLIFVPLDDRWLQSDKKRYRHIGHLQAGYVQREVYSISLGD